MELPISAISEQNILPINKGNVVVHDHSKHFMFINLVCFVFEEEEKNGQKLFFLMSINMGYPILAILEQNRLHICYATLYPLIRSPIQCLQKKIMLYLKRFFCF